MPGIKLEKFGGMLPAWDDHILPEGQAALSVNTYLFSGALNGWRQPKLLHAMNNTSANYAFRIPNTVTNNTLITAPDSFWWEFVDADTNVLHSPVVSDSFNRYYAASPSQLPQYNTYARIIAGQPNWLLGVPASGCSPGIVVTGGGASSQLGFPSIIQDGGPDFVGANTFVLIPIVPQGTLLLNDISFIPRTTNAIANVQGAIFSDLNGAPSSLLGATVTSTGVTSGTTVTLGFSNSIAVQPNIQYWIGLFADSNINIQITDGRSTQGVRFSSTFSNGPPAVAPGVTTRQPNWQIWGDFIGQSVFSARAYVYTWVTAYGEEGPPSAPTLTNGWSNGAWTISLFTPQPSDMGVNRNITKTRIYRTISGSTGLTSYFLVAEIPVAQSTFVDTAADNVVAQNSQLASLFWTAPPTDLQGFVALPNGIFAGFRSNEIWFCEPYRPHAWPPGYVLTTEFPIVGLGVCGQSLVACTQGTPYLITGVNPATMSSTKIELHEPCLFRGSIISTDTTVIYASQNGLIQVSQSGQAANITEQWVTRERWKSLTPQKFIRAIKHASAYFAFGTVSGSDTSVAQLGYTVELSTADQTSFTVWPQAGGHRLGFSQLTSPNGYNINNVLVDAWTGVGLLVQNQGVYYYDFTDTAPTIVPFKWRSRIYQQTAKRNFEAFRAFFQIPPNTPTQNATRNTATVQVLGTGQYLIVRVFVSPFVSGQGTLWTTREVQNSGELLRILSGTKVEEWQFELEGRVNVSNLQVATSVKELGLV